MSNARTEPNERTLQVFRERFPQSLVGLWSTFGDDYQMIFGHTVRFDADGKGIFYMWDVDDEVGERETRFRWTANDQFEVEVLPIDSDSPTYESDWGRFVADFYLSENAYGIKSVALRDGRQGTEPFWWFLMPDRHPMTFSELPNA
jgi:hypothetical protein